MQLIQNISETDLVDRFIQGDQTAFELLFLKYYPGLVQYASQFTADQMDSEEIVQEFFVRFWEKRKQNIQLPSLKSYLFLSIKNACLNYLKHKKVEQKYILEMKKLSDHHLVYNPNLYLDTELQDVVTKAIDLLPEKCREIFVMSRVQGLKNDEIASELNLSKRTVETQISKALKFLRSELKDYSSLLVVFGIF